MTPSPPITDALFDFDGTLCDSLDAFVRISNSLAPEFGFRLITPEELPSLRGKPPREFMRHLGIPWVRLPQISVRARQAFTAEIERTRPFPGINDALKALRSAGVRLGVVSSNSAANVTAFLRLNGMEPMDYVSGELGLLGKARKLKSLLKERGIRPGAAVYVGDEIRDVEAARSAGMTSVAVTWGYATREALSGARPDVLVDRPEELASRVLKTTRPAPKTPLSPI